MILMTRPTVWQPQLLATMQSAYRVDRVVGRFQVYRPLQF